MRWVGVQLLFLLVVPVGTSQVNLLSVREAESIVARIPNVEAAERSGMCPSFTVTYGEGTDLWVQVRASCGTTGGALIDNYTVNRADGRTTVWGGEKSHEPGSQVVAYASSLTEKARLRSLTAQEARCLTNEGVRSLPGWGGSQGGVSVAPFGEIQRGEARFTASLISTDLPIQVSRLITVDMGGAWVRDDETGDNLMSADVGKLLSMILGARTPPWLTDAEALAVAASVPEVVSRISPSCRLVGGGVPQGVPEPEEFFARVICEMDPRGGVVAVNLRTGAVSDFRSHALLGGVDTLSIASRMLAAHEARAANLNREIARLCGQPDGN